MKLYKHDDPEIQNLMKLQAIRTTREIIEMCADICDKNRGHLQVGDTLRKLLPPEPVNIAPTDNKPQSHLSVVK